MSVDQTTPEFARLTKEQQAGVLCRLGVRLTTLSRSFVSDRKKRGINEICHKIFGQLGHITFNSTQRYPDATFVDLLNAIAAENHLAKEFSDALVFALNVDEVGISSSGNTLGESRERRRAKVPSE
jgi:hypothetical protein